MRKRIAVDSHSAFSLRRSARRTRIVRLVLALAAFGLVLAAAASARGLEAHERGLLPPGTTAVVIVDLSLSIGEENYQDVAKVLERTVDANEPVGLIVFSDVPYELLPPGTPAGELRPVLRLLAPEGGGVPNPWQQGFRAGTRISESLALARYMLKRDHVSPGGVLLISDLETAPDDFDALGRQMQLLLQRGIKVRIVPLGPSSETRRFFEALVGKSAFTEVPQLGGRGDDAPGRLGGGTPLLLIILAGSALIVLAVHERFGSRLSLPRKATGPA